MAPAFGDRTRKAGGDSAFNFDKPAFISLNAPSPTQSNGFFRAQGSPIAQRQHQRQVRRVSRARSVWRVLIKPQASETDDGWDMGDDVRAPSPMNPVGLGGQADADAVLCCREATSHRQTWMSLEPWNSTKGVFYLPRPLDGAVTVLILQKT